MVVLLPQKWHLFSLSLILRCSLLCLYFSADIVIQTSSDWKVCLFCANHEILCKGFGIECKWSQTSWACTDHSHTLRTAAWIAISTGHCSCRFSLARFILKLLLKSFSDFCWGTWRKTTLSAKQSFPGLGCNFQGPEPKKCNCICLSITGNKQTKNVWHNPQSLIQTSSGNVHSAHKNVPVLCLLLLLLSFN